MSQRRICVATGSRAEYGLLRNVMGLLRDDNRADLSLLVTGMHLVPEFGMTVDEIIADGFPVSERVESQFASDTPSGMVKSLGVGVVGCTDSLERLAPDVVVLLGDRYEIFAVAMAASFLGIPVAHICGGEVTEGAVDDWIRHAITKAAWWHFVAAEPYRRRVIQLGESPERVFCVGTPGLDSVDHLARLDRKTLEDYLGLKFLQHIFLVTYHPATLGDSDPKTAFSALLDALDHFKDATVILTHPNADAGGRALALMADAWAERNADRARCVVSLGQERYLSLMRHADAVIGNSSSGIVEAPALKVPTVNIGPRQDGRLRATSIIDCDETYEEIVRAIESALSQSFRDCLPGTTSVYGDPGSSARITEHLLTLPLPDRLRKIFHDV
jgi:UDP-N-acetylglucosamine 2-epimerase (non-hydrolysing)/GDP/UDP-N,N'-diacetylbacillosamine 2-epimerase (hydrolysing)